MTEAVDFRWHARSIRWIELLLVVPLALGVLMMLSDAAALGAVWVAVFAALIARLEHHARSRAVVITVDSKGLFDRRMTVAPLAWPDIAGIEEFEAEHMRYVGVELRDPAAATSRLRWLPWTARPLHRIFGFPALSISTSLLDGTTDDLLAAIQRLRPGLTVVQS